VDGLSFDAGPGRVTGFPGPNGTQIRTPGTGQLVPALDHEGITAQLTDADTVQTCGADPDGSLASPLRATVVVLELSSHAGNLEELFFDLISDHSLEVSRS
jgi:hypothetical protein